MVLNGIYRSCLFFRNYMRGGQCEAKRFSFIISVFGILVTITGTPNSHSITFSSSDSQNGHCNSRSCIGDLYYDSLLICSPVRAILSYLLSL